MAPLNLPKEEFMKSFFETIDFLKQSSTPKEIVCKLKCNSRYFYDLNLEDISFVAKNKYELWLLIYKYLIQHTRVKTLQKISFDSNGNLQILNKVKNKSYDEYYNIGEYWEIRNICQEEENTNLDIKDIIDLVVDDLFNSKILWIERCKN